MRAFGLVVLRCATLRRYCFIHYPKGSSGASAPRENAAEAWVAFADGGHKKWPRKPGPSN